MLSMETSELLTLTVAVSAVIMTLLQAFWRRQHERPLTRKSGYYRVRLFDLHPKSV
jgi:hypothetical protein